MNPDTPSFSPQTTEPPSPPVRTNWLNRTGMYGFELLMALFGLFTSAVVLDYGLFALVNYLQGPGDTAQFVGEASLWIAVAMFVWLPVTMFFYLRARGEADRNPLMTKSKLHKLLVAIFLFSTIVTAIGALFTALYTLLRSLIGIETTATIDLLIQVSLPAFLVFIVHGSLAVVFMQPRLIGRRLFALIFSAVSVLVVLILLVTSIGTVRAQALDDRIEDDLRSISQAIRENYSNNRQLPASLSQLEGLDEAVVSRLDNYEYHIVENSNVRYELCASFSTESDYYDEVSNGASEYSAYANFTDHPAGRYCFKLAAAYDYDLDSFDSGSFFNSPSTPNLERN